MERSMENFKSNGRYPDWSMLPKKILEHLWKLLTIPDQAIASSVCKKWHSSTSNKANIWAPDIPWLITDIEDTSPHYSLFSISLQKIYKMEKPFLPLDNTFIVGSCKGWLVIRSEVEIFILNLFSKVRIDLPLRASQQHLLNSTPTVFTMSMCADLNPIIVAGVTFDGGLVWCNISDKEWKVYIGDEEYGNLAFYNDKLYAINHDGDKIDVFRIEDDELIPKGSMYATFPTSLISDNFDIYLVESKGSLLVVKRYFEISSILGQTINFEIFKVQERIDDVSPHQLVKMESLEDQVLFVSGLYCESLPSKHCSMLQEDHIYFIGHHAKDDKCELGIFSVNEGSMHRVPLTDSTLNYPYWLCPRYAFACNCKYHDSTVLKRISDYETNV